jgi:phosphoketolase
MCQKGKRCSERDKEDGAAVVRCCSAAVDQLVMACCGHAVLLSLNRAIAKFQHFL